MSKLRRNNYCSSPGNRNKASSDEIKGLSKSGKMKLNKSKLMSHGDFLNRIQKSLYYGGGKAKMSIPLSDYIAESFTETHNGYSLNRLNYSTIGNLRSTPCSLILAMIYLERLKDADPAYTKHVSPTELFLVSMMVATKFYSGHDDEAPYVNWAECLSVTPENLLQMELYFLNSIDWKVYVSNEDFYEKVKSLEVILARRQGTARGFFTYMELNSVMPSVQITKQFIQSILVLGLSYTVFIATMLASVFLVSQIPGTYLNASSRANVSLSSADVSLENSNPQQQVKTNVFSPATEPIESIDHTSESEISVLINLEFDRLKETSDTVNTTERPNATTSWTTSIFSSWFSSLRIDSIQWPVIQDSLDLKFTCDNDLDGNLFCNSSLCNDLLYPEQKFGFNRLRMKWA